MEIERKFTVKYLPENLEQYPVKHLEQAYLNTEPVLRIRREDDIYYMTYKGGGMLVREEYNLPLNRESYLHLLPKCDGNVISKKRYLIPWKQYTIELDIFAPPFSSLIIAEVEFETEKEAGSFTPPAWFSEDVTYDPHYHNSFLSQLSNPAVLFGAAPSPGPDPENI